MQQFLVRALQHDPRLIKCSLSDHFVIRAPVSVAFFYPKPIPSDLIVNSLQHVLKDFPVFAGAFIYKESHLYLDCNNQGVRVTIDHSDSSLFHQMKELPKIPTAALVDALKGHVLTIKLGYYSDGMTIGYSWHHSVGDMSTFMEFLKALSAYAKGMKYPAPVILEDRESIFQQPTGKGVTQKGKLKRLSFLDICRLIRSMYSSKQGAHLYFTNEEIGRLKSALTDRTKQKLSRNDVLCAHLLEALARCRSDQQEAHRASIIMNIRSRLEIPSHVLGNYVDTALIRSTKPHEAGTIACDIHASVANYRNDPDASWEFVNKNGGIRNVKSIIPEELLPQYNNLLITNWTNFDVYSIDFGVATPYLFLPVGESPIPWVCCIVEGFNNRGLLVALVLPSRVTKALISPKMIEFLHRYRGHEEIPILSDNPWCK